MLIKRGERVLYFRVNGTMNSDYSNRWESARLACGKAFYGKAVLSVLVGILAFAYSVLEAHDLKAEKTGLSRFLSGDVSLRGRFHPQYDYLKSELEGTEIADPDRAERDYFRRILAGVKLKLNDQALLNYLTDVSDRIVKKQVVRLELRTSRNRHWHLGYQKAPFGFEDTTSSGSVKPIERSPNTRFWNDVVGLGTYHVGAYQYLNLGYGRRAVWGITHNEMGNSEWPDVFSGNVSLYGRLLREGNTQSGFTYKNGVDIAYQPYDEEGSVIGASLFCNLARSGYEFKFQGTSGQIDLATDQTARAYGWHAQISRLMGTRFEWVARVAQVDTGGYQAKISSLIRKAPYSGFTYRNVDSAYLGINFYVQGNELKLSAGYELGKGWDALSGVGPLDSVEELISGFRIRGQVNF